VHGPDACGPFPDRGGQWNRDHLGIVEEGKIIHQSCLVIQDEWTDQAFQSMGIADGSLFPGGP
jgi:hypothetical protein